MPRKLSRFLITALLMLWAVVMLLPVACQAAQPVLTITGTGLHHDVLIYEEDWSKYDLVERYYSSNNRDDFHHIWKVGGYDLFEVMGGLENIKSDQDYVVTFLAADGLGKTRTVSQLQSQYFYPNFDVANGEPVAPMIGFYRTDLYEHLHLPDPADVVWEDKALREDKCVPRLIMGQAYGDVSDKNQPDFLKNLERIVVGDDKKEPNKDGSSGRIRKKKTPEGNQQKTDRNPESLEAAVSASGASDDGENGQKSSKGISVSIEGNSGEIETGEITSDLEDKMITGTGGTTDREKFIARWPWIAAGAVVAAGLAGGGVYYYIRKRRISK